MGTGKHAHERAPREAFFHEARELSPLVGVETRSGTFLAATGDQVVGRSLFVKSARGEMGVVRRSLALLADAGQDPRRPGAVFLDVGANIGTSLITALNNGFERGVGIEPSSANRHLLQLNVVLNEMDDRITVLPVALSDREGRVDLALDPLNWGNHQVAPARAIDRVRGALGLRKAGVERVPSTTFDALDAEGALGDVGLTWIDAQGHEAHILAGASKLVERGAPLVMELWAEGLARDAAGEDLATLAAEGWTHVANLRAGSEGFRPVAEFDALAGEYADGVTDILLARLL